MGMLEAIEQNDRQTVQRLLAQDPKLAEATAEQSPLLSALYHGHKEMAEDILACKPNLNIFEAAAAGDLQKIKTLLSAEKKLALHYAQDGFTALQLAAFFGHDQAVQTLIAANADLNAQSKGYLKTTALLAAMASPKPSNAKILIEAGADVMCRGDAGYTPLHTAAQNGNVEMLKLLLQHGADKKATNDAGQTALMLAQAKGHEAAVQILLGQ